MKPSHEELRQALAEAERLRALNEDRHSMAKTLLYQHERLRRLEDVQRHAERLVKFGLDEQEHALLITALEAARRAEEAACAASDSSLGLA